MPTFKVTAPDGRVVRLTGDSAPTDQELEGIFANLPAKSNPIESVMAGPMSVGSSMAQNNPEAATNALKASVPAVLPVANPEVLPSSGQILGGMVGGYPGAVGGSMIGETLNQGMDFAKGNKKADVKGAVESLKNILGAGFATTVGEGIFRVPKALFFSKQIGGAAKDAVGKQIGEIAKTVSESKIGQTASVSAKAITDKIDEVLGSVHFERGPMRTGLTRIKNQVSKLRRDLTFDEARSLEQQLGREASFAQEASQGHFVTQPKAPKLNEAAKGLRSDISGSVDDIAEQAGKPEFKKLSAEYAKLAAKYPEKDLQKGMSLSNMLTTLAVGGGSGAYGITQGNVPASVVSVLQFLNSVPQKVRTQIFRSIIDKPITKGIESVARLGASSALRGITDEMAK